MSNYTITPPDRISNPDLLTISFQYPINLDDYLLDSDENEGISMTFNNDDAVVTVYIDFVGNDSIITITFQ